MEAEVGVQSLAQVLADNQQPVQLIGVNQDEVNDINLNHRNSKYFPGVELNKDLHATTDYSVLKDADIVLLAVPTQAIESVATQAA